MPQGILAAVRATPGVKRAAPLLEAPAQAAGPRGQRSVQLIGADSSLRALGGALVAHTELEPFAGVGAVLLPAPLARTLGVTRFGQELTLNLYGRSEHAPLYEQLSARRVGAIAQSPLVIAPLEYAQELAGQPGRDHAHPDRARRRSAPDGAKPACGASPGARSTCGAPAISSSCSRRPPPPATPRRACSR